MYHLLFHVTINFSFLYFITLYISARSIAAQ